MTPSSARPNVATVHVHVTSSVRLPVPRIDERERGIRQQRADARNTEPAPAQPATRYTSRARSAVEHQLAEARPGGDDFDGERSAEQRADDQAVDRRDRAAARALSASRQIRASGGTPRASVASMYGWPITSLIACDCRRSNIAASGSASAAAGHDQVAQQIARPPAAMQTTSSCRRPAASPSARPRRRGRAT